MAGLNTGTFSQPIIAERLYVPDFDLEDMNELRVSVVPRELRVNSLTRHLNSHEADIDIAVQQKFRTGDAVEIDPLIELTEEIANHFRLARMAQLPAAIWKRTEHDVLYSPEHWNQLRQFTSLLTLTFRVDR